MSLSALLEGYFPIVNPPAFQRSQWQHPAFCWEPSFASAGNGCVQGAKGKGGGYRRDGPRTRVASSPSLLSITACSEPLFLLTMSETSCGRLCSGMT